MRRFAAGVIVLCAGACASSDGETTPDVPRATEPSTTVEVATTADEPTPTDTTAPTTAADAPTTTAAPATTDTVATEDHDTLIEAVERYTLAFAEGDPDTAWAMVSQRCRDVLAAPEYRAAVAASGELYPDLEAVNVVADETTGLVDYEVGSGFPPYVAQPWVNEAGWKWDAC